MKKKPKLTLVKPGTSVPQPWPSPPRPLGQHGLAFWKVVHQEYVVEDAAGMQILANACAMLDRAEALSALIEEQGLVLRTRNGGMRANPAVAAELAARGFINRAIGRLGINQSELKSVGRPAGYSPPNREA